MDPHKLVDATFKTILGIPGSRKVSHSKIQQFAANLALVALGIRSGYMFDAFSIPRHDTGDFLDSVIHELRKITGYADVSLLTGSSFQDYFLVNVPMLVENLHRELLDSSTASANAANHIGTIFVSLSTPPHLTSIPSAFRENIIQGLLGILQASLATQETTGLPLKFDIPLDLSNPMDAIPLAAVILEFPIAYVPEGSDQTSFLSNTPLDVYECCLHLQTSNHNTEHIFLKFSCPSELSIAERPDTIKEKLLTQFSRRTRACGIQTDIAIKHTQVTLDRVAL